jgi:hypothetical protein
MSEQQLSANLPAPKTFAPSREDVLSTLGFFFGDPAVPEKLKDYSEHHAMYATAAPPPSNCVLLWLVSPMYPRYPRDLPANLFRFFHSQDLPLPGWCAHRQDLHSHPHTPTQTLTPTLTTSRRFPPHIFFESSLLRAEQQDPRNAEQPHPQGKHLTQHSCTQPSVHIRLPYADHHSSCSSVRSLPRTGRPALVSPLSASTALLWSGMSECYTVRIELAKRDHAWHNKL